MCAVWTFCPQFSAEKQILPGVGLGANGCVCVRVHPSDLRALGINSGSELRVLPVVKVFLGSILRVLPALGVVSAGTAITGNILGLCTVDTVSTGSILTVNTLILAVLNTLNTPRALVG